MLPPPPTETLCVTVPPLETGDAMRVALSLAGDGALENATYLLARMSERQISHAWSIGIEADLIREGASERERGATLEALRVLRRVR